MPFFEIFAAALAGFYAVIPSYGVAIILLTVAVRVVLLPLSIKQTKSMREMQKIQPEVKKLQAKHKGNRQKMNEEMMALYKEHGVNPFGGCAPMLLQLPVFIALYRVLLEPLEYLGHSTGNPDLQWPLLGSLQGSNLATNLIERGTEVNNFLSMRLDCSAAQLMGIGDPAACGTGTFQLSAVPVIVMILLMGFTTWYQQKQMQASRGPGMDQQAAQMQMMGRIMPLMLMVFGFNFPAGLVLYWLTTNVWTIGQQHIMLGAVGGGAPRGGDGKAAGKATAKPEATKPPGKPADGGRKTGGKRPGPTGAKSKKRKR